MSGCSIPSESPAFRGAMLHAVREGLTITDVNGDITLANDEARRLLGRAATETPVTDQLQYAAARVLMVSRSEGEVDGTAVGLVTTLRDRTELQQALHELSEARVLTDELRKQAHHHANHLQTIIALIYTRKYEEAATVCAKYAEMPQMLSDQVLEQVADPCWPLGCKSHTRVRRGVELRLDGTLENAWRDLSEDLTDIVGNLVDNAIDAASERRRGAFVRLSLARSVGGCLHICVRDNGRGIPEPGDQVFAPRWTTKGSGRGFGLALVCDKVNRLDGRITAHNDGGAVFTVYIPAPREEEESDSHVPCARCRE